MNYKDKAVEARELIKEVFKDVMIENTGRNDRFITMQSQTPVCHGKEMDFITNENEWICTECCKWQGEI